MSHYISLLPSGLDADNETFIQNEASPEPENLVSYEEWLKPDFGALDFHTRVGLGCDPFELCAAKEQAQGGPLALCVDVLQA